jgi:flavin-dependent dehydrogenase
MTILADKVIEEVGATDVHFVGNTLCVSLSDGREINVAIDRVEWLDWLAKATPEQRAKWSFKPGGFVIYWEELDDGIEVRHLLRMQPIA